jgi:hypothetical protein
MVFQGGLYVLTGKAVDAVETITSAITAYRNHGNAIDLINFG